MKYNYIAKITDFIVFAQINVDIFFNLPDFHVEIICQGITVKWSHLCPNLPCQF